MNMMMGEKAMQRAEARISMGRMSHAIYAMTTLRLRRNQQCHASALLLAMVSNAGALLLLAMFAS